MRNVILRTALVFLTLFSFLFANAQVQVGNGNTVGTFPVNPYYGYSYTQSIYLASEIGVGGTITELRYYFAGASLSSANDWTIYIGHTSKSEFANEDDWVDISTLTQVYSGTFTDPGTAGWVVFDIDDWTYDGTQNIIIAVDENASGYNGSGDRFYVFDTPNMRGLVKRSDSSNPDPANPGTANSLTSYELANIIFGGLTVACPVPTDLISDSVTVTSVDLSWTAGGSETAWKVIYGAKDFDPATEGTTVDADTNSFTLSNLMSETEYDVYVQADCGSGEMSVLSQKLSFTTLPSCPKPTALSLDSLASTKITLSWVAGDEETAWNVIYGEEGFDPTNDTASTVLSVNDTLATITGLTAETSYDVYVQANCGENDLSSLTGPINFFTGYCIPSPTSVDNNGITNVTFGQAPNVVNNTSGKESGQYGNYTAMVGDAQASSDLTVSITYQTGWTYNTLIWVDWNDDFDFDDEGEIVYFGESLADNPTTLEASFTVPLTAPVGQHRMRIFGSDSYYNDNCYTGSYGCVEDYTINVTEAPSCLKPTALALDSVAPTVAKLSWVAGASGETAWNVIYGAEGFDPTAENAGTVLAVSDTLALITGLLAETNYDVYVQADCGSGDLSAWSNKATVTTLPACAEPTALSVSNISSISATLSWTAGFVETDWLIIYGVENFDPATEGDTLEVSTNPMGTVNNLLPSTAYDVYVKAVCESDVLSSLSNKLTFTTACAAITPDYTEDFATFPPNCWERFKGNLGEPLEQYGTFGLKWSGDGFANDGYSGSARINIYGENCKAWLVSPEFDLSAGGYQLTYDVAATHSGNTTPADFGDDDQVQVLYTEDGGATWTNLKTYSNSNNNFPGVDGTNETIFIASTGSNVRIAFWASSTVAGGKDNDFFVDNFVVSTAPTCISPTAVTSANVETTTATISWDVPAIVPGIGYEYVCSTTETEPTADGTSTTGTTVDLTDLTAGTTYYVFVRSVCTDDDKSAWTAVYEFTTIPSCFAPTAVTSANVAETTATISWTAPETAPGVGYEYVCSTTETAPTADGTATTEVSVDLTDLTAGTTYYVFVRSVCTDTDKSAWTAVYEFTTVTATPANPFPEDFETSTDLPAGWNVINGGSADKEWYVSNDISNGAHSGTNAARIDYGSDAHDDYLVLPAISVEANVSDQLVFWAKNRGESLAEEYEVRLSTTVNNDASAFSAVLEEAYAPGTTWEERTVSLADYVGQTVYVAIRAISTNEFGLYIDDVDVMGLPTCPAPTALATNNITATEAELSWTAGGAESAWNVIYGEAGFDPATEGTTVGADANSFTLTGLTAETAYDVYVQADCGDEESELSSVVSFTTLATCPKPTALTADNATATQVVLSWTVGGAEAAWKVIYGEAGFDPATEGTTVDATSNPFTLTGLVASTDYEVYVKADCGNDDLSDLSNVVSFMTSCVTITPDYTQEFATVPPACWEIARGLLTDQMTAELTSSSTNGTTSWKSDGFANNGTTGAARANIYGAQTNDWLVSPTFDLSAGNYELKYDVAATAYDNSDPAVLGDDDKFLVLYTENGIDWNILKTYDANNTPSATGTTETISLTTTGAEVKFAFYTESTVGSNGDNDVHIDNFIVQAAANTCPKPTALAVSNLTANAADVAWTENGTATTWNLKVSTTSIDPATADGDVVANESTTNNPYSLSGLTENTTYYVYVQADCGSDWSDEYTFATEQEGCDVVTTLPFVEGFEGSTLPDCWTSLNVDGDPKEWQVYNNHPHTGQQAAYHGFSDSEPLAAQEGWLITPKIALPANGTYVLNFWEYTYLPVNYDKHSILVSTTGKNTADFTEIWTPVVGDGSETNPVDELKERTIDLSAYAGQEIYVAFKYEGDKYSSWFLDDINIGEESTNTFDIVLMGPADDMFSCSYTDAETVQVKVSNNLGNDPIPAGTTFTFTLKNDEGTTLLTEEITTTEAIQPSTPLIINTVGAIDLSAVGTINFTAYISAVGDMIADNDTVTGSFTHFEQTITFADEEGDNIVIEEGDLPYTLTPIVTINPEGLGLESTYLWADGSTMLTQSINTQNDAGSYVVTVTTEGCETTDSVELLVLTGINELDAENISIYPNPSSGQFKVNMTLAQEQDVIITVINNSGQVVREVKFDNVNTLDQAIDITGVATGLYNIRINAGGEMINRKLVIK